MKAGYELVSMDLIADIDLTIEELRKEIVQLEAKKAELIRVLVD